MPDQQNITPRYEQRKFAEQSGRQFILTPDARENSLKVHQDMTLSRWVLSAGEVGNIDIDPSRKIWVQVVKGEVSVNDQSLETSDAAAVWDEKRLAFSANQPTELLIFDLPPV